MENEPVRLVRVRGEGRRIPAYAILKDDQLYALRSSGQPGRFLGPLGSFTLQSPICPSKIICVGRNYAAHAAEHDAQVPEEPLLFLKPPSSVIGPDALILYPATLSKQVEHEAELAVVIKKRCRDVPPEHAWEYVLGVTCANDVTARDLQRKDGQWTRAKGFDTFCPLGPWVVVGLSETEVADLAITCTVNGEVRQNDRTASMVFSPAQLIAYASSVMTLEREDVILTGTPAGVGPLRPGDHVEVSIEKVGTLSNLVALRA